MKRIQFALVFACILCCVQQSFAQYAGGDNDGFGANQGCIQNLNGTSGLIPGAITGSTEFCAFATEAYSITVSGATSATGYTWTVPPGATITSGQGTASILITFGNTNGNVQVDVSNGCTLVSVSLPVTLSGCTFFTGGSNDGFTNNIGCIQNLNGGSALVPGSIVGSTQFCAFATEVYSITVSGATPSSVYTWNVPPGATVTSGQGTSSVLITFGGTDGNISVDVSNECETVNQTLAVTSTSCTFFAGGNNDGFTTNVGCIQNLNGGSALVPGPIVGSTQFCAFATEVYSITVSGATPSSVYTWNVPPGATVTSGQGTSSVLVTFGGSDGNISVDVSNECETVNQTLAVTSTSCTFFAGGNNDGFTTNVGCIQNLNGGSALTPGAITGSTEFCSFASEAYTITVAGATASTTYIWSGPAGSTILSGQGTNSVLVLFGSTSGTLSVNISNECETVNVTQSVNVGSCPFYLGGSNDGFSVTTTVNIPLPVELVSFSGIEEDGRVELMWETESELNNDFFIVERSPDGRVFNPVTKVSGSGTTNEKHTYYAMDNYPYNTRTYYRLVQYDFDGHINYSKIISVQIAADGTRTAKLFPNPIINRNELFLRCYNQLEETASITYIDSKGITVRSERYYLVKGFNEIRLRPDFNDAGIYILQLKTHAGVKTFRIAVP